ncbi:adenosylcobinamide amidohydrolase [Shimia sp. SDUM112013]|uniref:adenosylcobinamide amidohydrolase n=1 Tax=Shimia sp. SDUM112013 TaxID=3136160 RepID=UPI0032ED6F98
MNRVTVSEPWLDMDLGGEMNVLSWAVNKPGFVKAHRILWREVKNGDLPPFMDVHDWLDRQLAARQARDAVTFLTSRRITAFEETEATVGQTTAHAVATVGLSNAEHVGQRVDYSKRDWGTINVALRLNQGLSQTGLIEAMSIVVMARTAAVMDMRYDLPTGIATGTGTDCVAVAAPEGTTDFAGMHTEIGETIGRAVYDAVQAGARKWGIEQWGTSKSA